MKNIIDFLRQLFEIPISILFVFAEFFLAPVLLCYFIYLVYKKQNIFYILLTLVTFAAASYAFYLNIIMYDLSENGKIPDELKFKEVSLIIFSILTHLIYLFLRIIKKQ